MGWVSLGVYWVFGCAVFGIVWCMFRFGDVYVFMKSVLVLVWGRVYLN